MSEEKAVQLVGYVDARIAGRSIRFRLPRDPYTFRLIEEFCGPLSALWQRMQRGQHSTADVRIILAAAHPFIPAPTPANSPVGRIAVATQLMRDEPQRPKPINGAPLEVVDALMRHIPYGGWEELAALIMAAAISGLPADKAVFTDRPDEKRDAAT